MIKKSSNNILFVGIDCSINHTGVVVIDKKKNVVDYIKFDYDSRKKRYLVKTKSKEYDLPLINNDDRLRGYTVAEEILSFFSNRKLVISLEDYAFNGSGLIFQIAEFTGVIKSKLLTNNYEFSLKGIKTAKKAITGRGNANKLHIKLGLEDYLGFSFGEDDDLNDALVLALMSLKVI